MSLRFVALLCGLGFVVGAQGCQVDDAGLTMATPGVGGAVGGVAHFACSGVRGACSR